MINMSNHNLSANKLTRTTANECRPVCIWLTGLSGSGKSTIASILQRRLNDDRYNSYVLDGDRLRGGINVDLGFEDDDRKESVRRTAEIARLMVDAGLIVIVALISPFMADRALARSLFNNQEFIEVFIDASISECIRRDSKGLYAKALSGQLQNFTGISSEYEPPESPDVHIYTETESPSEGVHKLFKALKCR
jgi:bifunctional enzyme CysN/CysC